MLKNNSRTAQVGFYVRATMLVVVAGPLVVAGEGLTREEARERARQIDAERELAAKPEQKLLQLQEVIHNLMKHLHAMRQENLQLQREVESLKAELARLQSAPSSRPASTTGPSASEEPEVEKRLW